MELEPLPTVALPVVSIWDGDIRDVCTGVVADTLIDGALDRAMESKDALDGLGGLRGRLEIE